MQRVIRPKRALVLSLLLGYLAIFVYMHFILGFAHVSLQALPMLYWMLLFLLPISLLISVLFRGSTSLERGITSNNARGSFGLTLLSAGLMLLMGFSNNLIQPAWGGNTVLFVSTGCICLVAAYAIYRRYRA